MPDTNSAAVLVVHVLGSEADVLRIVHGDLSTRDREGELDLLQQQLSVVGAEIGETMDALDLERLRGGGGSGDDDAPS